jgi:hypothetical protein
MLITATGSVVDHRSRSVVPRMSGTGVSYYRMQQILQSDAPKHLRADTIGDAVHDLRPILGRVHVDAKGPFAEGRIDYIDNGRRDRARVGVCRLSLARTLVSPSTAALVAT